MALLHHEIGRDAMSVRDAVDRFLASSAATEFERELALALAKQIDNGFGAATAAKELRSLMVDIEQRTPSTDVLDELAKKRAARRSAG